MAGACASTFRSAPSGIPTLCGVWQSARRMCCSWLRTYCVDKSCDVNMIEQAMQVSEARRWSESHFSLPGVKGIGGHSRFMRWKPTWLGFTASPPRRCACVQLGTRVRGSRRSGIETPVSQSNPLRRHGEGRRGGFLFCGSCRKALPVQPSEQIPGTNLRHPAYHLAGSGYPAPEIREERVMRSPAKAVGLLAILTLGAASALAKTGAEP